LERQIIKGQEQPLDRYEDYEEKEEPSEDIAALHFQRIQAIPVLSDAEEQDLLQRWCEFRDEKAKERIVRAHMRMVPTIALNAAYKAGFQPNYEMMAGSARWIAGFGFDEVIADLTAAGNLGLVQAIGGYRLGQDVRFYTYARQCVRHEIWKQATFFRSAVRRKDGSPAKWDLSIDPLMPDVHDTRDYCGSRKMPSVNDDPEDDDGANTGTGVGRLRPKFEEPINIPTDCLTDEQYHIIIGRMTGLKLEELAKELGLSTATVWRREKTAIARIRAHHGNTDSRGA